MQRPWPMTLQAEKSAFAFTVGIAENFKRPKLIDGFKRPWKTHDPDFKK